VTQTKTSQTKIDKVHIM